MVSAGLALASPSRLQRLNVHDVVVKGRILSALLGRMLVVS